MTPIGYPETKKMPVVEEHFGRTVVDPYRWLENDAASDQQVAEWVEAQNALTREYLDGLPARAVFAERMTALLDHERVTAPVEKGGRYFYLRNSGRDSQSKLYMREGIDGPAKELIDPNPWSDDGGDALAEWAASDDGDLVAYGVQQGGTDWRTIHVLDVDTGTVLKDRVEWVRFSDIAWAPDRSGFFYARFPAPTGEGARASAISGHSVYFHAIGTDQSKDELIYTNADRPSDLVPIQRTADGRYLAIYATPGAGANALMVVDLESEDWTPRMLVRDLTADWGIVDNIGTRLYVTTNDEAERGRIVVFDLADQEPVPVTVVEESDAVLSGAALLGGRLMAAYMVDAQTEVRRFMPDGTPDGTLELPAIGSAGGFQGSFTNDHAFFNFSSFDTPITVYRYDVAANSYEVWAEPGLVADFSDVVVEQKFFASKDGTRVPMFVVRKSSVSGPAPTLLYGYGGFGLSMVPYYNAMQMAWVEQGGVLAIANIRGGGEYGMSWYRAGQLENRQNAYDDFIAAGEFLKAERISSEDGLVVQGESNGGLLVGVVTNQRPDLFAAALPGVGVMDMLRYHRFTGGAMWITEFGSPEDEKHFSNLISFSPYHNIKEGEDYPAVLATTADTDDRVVPGHSFKYVAALQAADLGDRPRLVRIETRAGHGAGMSLEKIVALHADQWAFAAHWAGLTVAPPTAPIGPMEMEASGPLGPLKGTFVEASDPRAPTVLILPGSGPADRDGNSPLGVTAAPYRLLAEELAARGISSLRVDKRGLFGSAEAVADANAVTVDDYVEDAHAWTRKLTEHTGAGCTWLLGHSEGGLVALAAAQDDPSVCGLILVATPGRPLGDVIKEQIRRNPANASFLDQAESAIDALTAGHEVDTTGMPAPLASLFAPEVQGFLMSALALDPAALASQVSKPILIVQGESDVQVGVEDAERLKANARVATLVRLENVNHVLKIAAPDDLPGNLATYSNSALPLAPGVVEAISDFVFAFDSR